MKVTVRSFELSDLSSVEDIERRSFLFPWSRIEFMLAYENYPRGFLVGIGRKRLMGYIVAEVVDCLKPRMSLCGHILNIAVDPKFRRCGIGKTLVTATLTRLQEEDASAVWLEVRASNFIGKQFYSAMGFEEKGRKIGYYNTEDAVVMRKRL